MKDVGGYLFMPLGRGKGYKAHVALGITDEGYVSGGVDGSESEVEYLMLDLYRSLLDRNQPHALLILRRMTMLAASVLDIGDEVEDILNGEHD